MLKTTQFLSQKQSQQQRLSPQQIQYIKLLQLPTYALEQRIKEEMEINPVLEEGSQQEEASEYEENEQTAGEEQDAGEEEGDPEPVDQNDEIDWEEFMQPEDSDDYTTTYNPDLEELKELPNPYHETLLEELEQQVTLLSLNEREQLIADQILGSLDSDGYFRRNIDSVVDNIAFNQGATVSGEEVEKVRNMIMRLDPPGMAASSLRECLLVQLEVSEDQNEDCKLAYKIIDQHWEDFEKKHFDKIIRKLDIDEEQLREAYDCIQLLDPKPGAGGDVSDDSQNYIEPDFEVYYQPSVDEYGQEEDNGDFIITLNSRNVPPLRISPQYKKMWEEIKQKKSKDKEHNNHNHKNDKETQNFIKSKIESAQWFIDSIRQRQNTLMGVMKTIVALQEHYFKYGEGLKPMILKDVAERVNLDISTISRVVNGKYVQTNFGVFELKYFFSEGIQTTNGEEVSSREVKDLLLDIINKEDKRKPLSDQALAQKLKDHGYKVARRTVSKYREQLNIPVGRLRKQVI